MKNSFTFFLKNIFVLRFFYYQLPSFILEKKVPFIIFKIKFIDKLNNVEISQTDH